MTVKSMLFFIYCMTVDGLQNISFYRNLFDNACDVTIDSDYNLAV